MRLFISYARVDKPYCVQIVHTLDVHEVWYDQRLYAGQQWWKEILRRIDWCDGFVYLMSSDSVASPYCLRELEIAMHHNRQIIPVMIQKDTPLPPTLGDVQYVDLTDGLNQENVTNLLNSVLLAERQSQMHPSIPITAGDIEEVQPVTNNTNRIVTLGAEAMENGRYDQALFLFKQAMDNGFKSRFIDIRALAREAEIALEKQTEQREKEREYGHIVDLMSYRSTSPFGCDALEKFLAAFPGYDPDDLLSRCQGLSTTDSSRIRLPDVSDPISGEPERDYFELSLLEFITIPEGVVQIESDSDRLAGIVNSAIVPEFRISRYPVTNEQFQAFVEDRDGYQNQQWWSFSKKALEWYRENPEPRPPSFKSKDRPREMVTWYEAVAFTRWLSHKMELNIALPAADHWRRAVQGEDARIFPWGNTFDSSLCNTRESRLKMTTPVNRYEDGQSPYGVFDLAGNIWEWCVDRAANEDADENADVQVKRQVIGGSFVSPLERSQVNFHYNLDPRSLYSSIGFRLVHLLD